MRKLNATAAEEKCRKAVGARLRQLREQAGLTLDQLAELAEVGKLGKRGGPTIGAWEREGGTTFDTALKVVEALAGKIGRSRSDVLAYIAWG